MCIQDVETRLQLSANVAQCLLDELIYLGSVLSYLYLVFYHVGLLHGFSTCFYVYVLVCGVNRFNQACILQLFLPLTLTNSNY